MKNIIWSSDINIEDWKEVLLEEAEERGVDINDVSEAEKYEWVCDLNNSYLDDERTNLDVQLDNKIIAIADIGRWNGRVTGYKLIESGNIKDILYSDGNCEPTWYVEDGDVKCKMSHHDGTNYVVYREVKPDVDIDDVIAIIMTTGKISDEDIDKYTTSIADKVNAVYGW